MNAALNSIGGNFGNTLGNIGQYANGVNNINGLSINAYPSGLNGVNGLAALSAMNNIVGSNQIANLTNLQNLTNHTVTGFTPTFETERGLSQASLNGLAGANDFNLQNNFVGVIADGAPYPQTVNITQTNGSNLNGQTSFGLNMSLPTMQKNVMQGLVASTSPTSSMLATLSSLPGQQNMFALQNQLGNGVQAVQLRQPEQLAMKMMGPSILTLRGTHVAHGN